LLWLFLGSGFAESFRPPGLTDVSYASFLLPGAMTLVAVFAAVFSAISIIEDRQAGWLQGVLVSPAPRWSLAAGRIAGSAVTAWLQAAPLLLLALLALDLDVSALGAARSLAALAVTCVAVAGLGLATAWKSETTAGFHAVMNLLFLPMWMLSGAFFPADGAAPWLGAVMRANPLAWCTDAIRGPLHGTDPGPAWPLMAAFAVVMVALAVRLVSAPARS
ncbi:MAG: ABC transporter permease, partial [Planctomycetota bacterium]